MNHKSPIFSYRRYALALISLLMGLALLTPDWGTELRAQELGPDLDFGEIIIGNSSTLSTTLSFTTEFPQYEGIDVVSVDILSNGASFSIANDGCAGAFLQNNESCNIAVRFFPLSIGPFSGQVQVTVRNCDLEQVECDTPFSVTANLSGVGAGPPIDAVDDTTSTNATEPVNFNVLTNDTGTDLVLSDVSNPTHGNVVWDSAGNVTYTPNSDFASPPNDTFTYTVFDSYGQVDTATVTVTVIPPAIDAVDDTASTPAGAPVTINVFANDSGTGIAISDASDPAHGSVTINNGGTDGTITYTPDAGFASPPNDSFTYTIVDAFGQSDTATVTVTVNPPGLNAVDDTASTPAATPVTINVLANDSGTSLSVTHITIPANGNAVINGDGTITYTPHVGFANGSDSFNYTVTDSFGQSDTATVTVTVTAPNLNAVNDTAVTPANTPVSINVLNNDIGSGLSITQVSTPSSGSAVVNADDSITFTPATGFVGIVTFTYTISDGISTDTATVTVTVTAPNLDAVNDAASTPARQAVAIAVLANDVGSNLAIVQVSKPANGTAVANADGTITYTPATNFAGVDTFTYTISDGIANDTATVTVTVIAPKLDAVDDSATAVTGQTVAIPVLANDVGSPLTVVQVGKPANGEAAIQGDGTIDYTSDASFQGNDSFTYTVSDGIGNDTATVSVTVTLTKEQVQETLEDLTENPNAQSVGQAIGGLCYDRTASAEFLRDCDALVEAALKGDPQAGPALEQITPASIGTAVDTTQTSVQTQSANIRTRLFSLRNGINGINIDRLNLNRGGWTLSGQDLRYLMANLGGGGPTSEPSHDLGGLGIFAAGTLNWGNKDETDEQAGYDFETYGLTVGADYRFTDQWVGGAAFSYSSTGSDIDSHGGSLDSQGYTLTLYGTYYQSERFYLDGLINYGWMNYDQRRNVLYQLQDAAVNQSFDADYNGRQFYIDLGAGYEFGRGNLTYGPEIRLSYLDVQVDDYQEHANNNNAGSAWAVGVDDQDLESLTLTLGGQIGYLFSQSWGTLEPQVELKWLHEFKDNNRVVRGTFIEGAGVPDNFFELATDPVERDYFRFGIGVSAQFSGGASAVLRYRTLLDYNNLEDHTISAEFRWDF
ncbi:MAG: tandem-95 repeat protein [Gammaproteobacteria bacterium]|nr:tandem-95 repeat protein [Gammaproteobacteria bacterium]